jgi:Zn-dependent peptidase ImmA (M78 family)
VDPKEIRGMAISKPSFPIILLNGSDKVNGRIFTLMHELVHIIQNKSSICDLTEQKDIEVFCNKVAGNILVPREDLLEHPLVSNHQGIEWSEKELKSLSNYFGVSKGVIVLRLINLKRANNEFYDEKKEEWDKINANTSKKGGGSFDYRTIIKLNGRLFSRQMLNAYEKNLINQVEFARYMGIKLKHLPDLRENVGRGSL